MMGWRAKACRVLTRTIFYFKKTNKNKNKTKTNNIIFFALDFSGGGDGAMANQITVYHSLTSDHPPILTAPALTRQKVQIIIPQVKPPHATTAVPSLKIKQRPLLCEKDNDSTPA